MILSKVLIGTNVVPTTFVGTCFYILRVASKQETFSFQLGSYQSQN